MIFEPGQSGRRDIYANTSAVDLLPTLLHITGQPTSGLGRRNSIATFRAK